MNNAPYSDDSITYKYQHSLTALEIRMQLQSDDFSDAENKSQQYINISAIVFAIIAAFSVSQSNLDVFVKVLLLPLLAGFAFVFYHTPKALSPRGWERFLNTDIEREQFQNWVKNAKNLAYHEAMLETYMKILRDNDAHIEIKRRHNNLARYGIYFQLGVTFILVVQRIVMN